MRHDLCPGTVIEQGSRQKAQLVIKTTAEEPRQRAKDKLAHMIVTNAPANSRPAIPQLAAVRPGDLEKPEP